jgi:hypothetical protein
LFGAYTALHYLGIDGYQRIIVNSLQNANYFRYRLGSQPGAKLMALQNHGPSVGFRLYDPKLNPDAEFNFEYHVEDSDEYRARLDRNNRHHRGIFLRRGKVGLYTNWVEFIAHTDYDNRGRCGAIPGEKAVFMNPPHRLRTHRSIHRCSSQLNPFLCFFELIQRLLTQIQRVDLKAVTPDVVESARDILVVGK